MHQTYILSLPKVISGRVNHATGNSIFIKGRILIVRKYFSQVRFSTGQICYLYASLFRHVLKPARLVCYFQNLFLILNVLSGKQLKKFRLRFT